jgi:hypothetical protein
MTTVKDTATLNRYELRKFGGNKAVGRIANKSQMCKLLGLPQTTLDQWEKRYPDFPLPVYKTKTVRGAGWHYYYSTREVEEFIVKREAGRVSRYEDIIKRVATRGGQSKYGAVLERLGIDSEVK